jgi:hypothetical protein
MQVGVVQSAASWRCTRRVPAHPWECALLSQLLPLLVLMCGCAWCVAGGEPHASEGRAGQIVSADSRLRRWLSAGWSRCHGWSTGGALPALLSVCMRAFRTGASRGKTAALCLCPFGRCRLAGSPAPMPRFYGLLLTARRKTRSLLPAPCSVSVFVRVRFPGAFATSSATPT